MKYTQHSLLFKDTEDTNLRRREGMAVQEEKIMQAEVKEYGNSVLRKWKLSQFGVYDEQRGTIGHKNKIIG